MIRQLLGIFIDAFADKLKKRHLFTIKLSVIVPLNFINSIFDAALGEAVEVEITQSIISGAKSCRILIHIKTGG
jgi:hypothetical protein